MGGCEFLNSVANSRKFGIVNWSGASRLTQGRIPQMINHPNRSKSVGAETAITSEIAAKVLATIREIVRAGVVSVHKIASTMNERGVPTRRGGQWSGTAVLNTIRRCGFQTVSEVVASA